MTVQLALLGDPVTISQDGRPLTPRQQHVLDYIASSPDGRDAAEVGAMLHELRGAHRAGYERCRWCAEEGLGVLRSAALRPLLIRRRTGMWQLRRPLEEREPQTEIGRPAGAGRLDASSRGASSRSSNGQLTSLPGSTFEDLFGDAA